MNLQPLYDPFLTQPMRDELTNIGIKELRTTEEVDAVLPLEGTTLVYVNSVCGCAAGGARPAMKLLMQNKILPDRVVTVFAGQDREATQRAREYFVGYPPSSPQVALLKDGKIIAMMQRHHIEGYPPEAIANALIDVVNQVCAKENQDIA